MEFLRFETEKANVYNIFTALLCQPAEDLMTDINIFEKLSSALAVVCPECIEAASELRVNLLKYTHTELLVEYTRLFIGPFSLLVPPYSGMYFGAKDLMSEQTLWVINYYEKMGLQYDVTIKDSPDHIAVETEFLYNMVYQTIIEYGKGEKGNALKYWQGHLGFFSGHYKLWVPGFCKKIRDNSANDFYRSMAVCLDTFVKSISNPEFPE